MSAPTLASCAVLRLSPWPAALLVRRSFDATSRQTSQRLEKHVPGGVTSKLDERYDLEDEDAVLDVFYPSEVERPLPTVVWVHGGGWISGNQRQVANYARVLASHGYTVISVNYSLAPGCKYPKPVRQIVKALGYLGENARRLHVDPSCFFLAGDSAGAQLCAQVANVVTSPLYAAALGLASPIGAAELAGVLLFCGAYDLGSLDLDGELSSVLRTVLWAYSGTRSFLRDPSFATFSVLGHVTSEFPPTFISSGNHDPITPQSRALETALRARGIEVDTLFFAEDYVPGLEHEYQFDLDGDAGRLALRRCLEFLSKRARGASPSARLRLGESA